MPLTPAYADALRALLRTQPVAALGTLHQGKPAVSMVPYAVLARAPAAPALVIHVSRLATHTKDMLTNPDVSLLVVAAPRPEVPVQALARITVQGRALPCPEGAAEHADARAAYLARFPGSAEMFGFADFSLFLVVPSSVRFVGGFAQASTISAEALAAVLEGD